METTMTCERAPRAVRLFALAALFVCVLALPAIASTQAQPSYQVRFVKAENTIRVHEPKITWWEQQSQITLGIGLTIVALGIATGVLQALTRPWTKPVTLVVGALVTALTAVNTTFFDGDYKTLADRASEGRSLVEQADRFIALAPSLTSDGDREEALRYIQETAEALAQLAAGGSKGRPVEAVRQSTRLPSFASTLFAAGPQCGCAALKQQDTEAYRYFCGEGTATSLSEARKSATENAVMQANTALQRSPRQAVAGDLLSYVRSVSSEVAACPRSGSKGFTMFVVLRVPSTLTSPVAQQAFVRPAQRSSRVRLTLDRIRVIQDGSSSTTKWRFEVRAGGKSFSLPDRRYTDRANRNDVVLTPADGAVLDVDADINSPLQIEVTGRRSAANDTAIGAQVVTAGTPIVVNVRHATDAAKGSFEFTFSVTPR
jgi:hypothetical protein